MKATGTLIERLLSRCENVLIHCSTVAALGIMCLTGADALGRYLFNQPILWAYEITENYLMVLTVFLAVCHSYRRGSFIRVSFLVDRLPQEVRVVMNYFAQVFCILLSLCYLLATIHKARSMIEGGGTLSAVPLPLGPAYVIVPVGFFFLTLAMGQDLWRAVTKKSDLFKEGDSGM